MPTLVIPRGLARSFRAVARKSSTGRPRGPAPPVILTAAGGRVTLTSFGPDAVLVCDVPAPGEPSGTVIVPAAVLDELDTAGPVEVETTGTRGVARWADRGGPREVPFDAVLPGRQHRPPDRPDRWAPVPPAFLSALHACVRTASREPTGRFALTRVQVRGKAGQLVGSDGKRALLWAGFRVPFPDDVLVPAVAVFGAKELAGQADVRVGRTATHLVVGAGPWAVFLPVDATARFPDVAGVVPRAAGAAVLDLSDSDAGRLLAEVPGLPGANDENAPVTLAVGPRPEARARTGDRAGNVPLPGSAASGPSQEVAVDRADLLRALALGFRRVRVAGPSKPVVWADPDRTYLAMPLTTELLVPAAAPGDPVAPSALPAAAPSLSTVLEPRSPTMTPRPESGRADPPPGADPPDPLAEAEALRAALADAAHRAGRLVQALKARRKEQKALAGVWAGLKSLNLTGGRP